MLPFYHRPAGGRTGDVIPIYHDGAWHVFYLNYRAERFTHSPPGARQTPWAHISSTDLITWHSHPPAIEPGMEGEVDSGSCATGTVVEHEGTFHLYYTGRYFTTSGERRETVCKATSSDLVTWTKDPGNPLSRPDRDRYSPGHWRDPFVLWNPEAREFWMVISTELRRAPTGRGGCLALLKSSDLQTWQPAGELLVPYGTGIPECPDVFWDRGWWFLLYSTGRRTRYRRARSLSGPWHVDGYDAFDGDFYYAAKSAAGGERRLLFGWVGDKEENRDDGRLEWGGNLVIRELVQGDDGQLATGHPAEFYPRRPNSTHPIKPQLGRWSQVRDRVTCESEEGFAYATVSGIDPDFQLRLTITPSPAARKFGLFLRTTTDLTGGYAVCIDRGSQLLTLGSVDPATGRLRNEISRPIPATSGDLPCTVTASSSIIDVALDETATLVGRFGDMRGDTVALFSEDGATEFTGLQIDTVERTTFT